MFTSPQVREEPERNNPVAGRDRFTCKRCMWLLGSNRMMDGLSNHSVPVRLAEWLLSQGETEGRLLAGLQRLVHLGLILAIVGAAGAPFLVPTNASADTNLIIGEPAVIAYANGDQVRMREEVGYEAPIIEMFAEGTWVTVLDGPFTDADGNYWYQVSHGEPPTSGYIVSDFLALESGVSLETVAQAEETPTPEASAPAVGAVVGIAYVAGTNGDGVRCRADASRRLRSLPLIPEGTTIELTGGAINGWQPINCGGGGGFISTEFVSYEAPGQAAVPAVETSPEPVNETPAVETETDLSKSPLPQLELRLEAGLSPEPMVTVSVAA